MPLTNTEHTPSRDHHHGMSLDDTFDFLNTIELESGSLVDRFESFDDAATWLIERGVCHSGRGPAALRPSDVDDDAALARVRTVRAALRDVAHAVSHGRPANSESLAEVNRAIAARERIELVRSPDGVSVGHSHVGDPLDDALARLADPLVHEVGAGRADRIRVCANDTCRWVFFDESRGGQRRWCDMASCGNRAKAARHRARVKASATAKKPRPEATATTAQPN